MLLHPPSEVCKQFETGIKCEDCELASEVKTVCAYKLVKVVTNHGKEN